MEGKNNNVTRGLMSHQIYASTRGCNNHLSHPKEAEKEYSDESDEWEEDDEYWWDEDKVIRDAQGTKTASRNFDPEHSSEFQSMRDRMHSEYIPSVRGSTGMSHSAMNSIIGGEKKAGVAKHLGLTSEKKATVDQVLDPRTILVLTKFIKNKVLNQIYGCISTGKEANVYYADFKNGDGPMEDRAVKVYKTTILSFKDRARYVEGEFRFRRGYTKSNPRKMVTQWCEKELRNLKRIGQCSDIRVPEPMEIRQNVLVMEFIGHDGEAAPRLKDARIAANEWPRIYRENIIIMRKMFQDCKLVHGDLSEYNLLWHEDELVVIDVSQSVEFDHPHALDFLKRDCINVNNFYERKSCKIIPLRLLFDYVTLDTPRCDIDTLLAEETETNVVDDLVFKNTWIPSSLQEVSDLYFLENELAAGDDAVCRPLLAETKSDGDKDEDEGTRQEDKDAENESSASGEDDKNSKVSESGEVSDDEKAFDGHKPEDMSKAEWKKLVKELRQEKLKTKIPKATKKKHRKNATKNSK